MQELAFKDFANLKDVKCVVAFGAPWCRDCKFAEPILNDLAKTYPAINFYHINVDKEENIRESMHISHIPTILFMKEGAEICERLVEPRSKEIIENHVKLL